MAKITVFFGIVLILLGAASSILTGSKFPTSLIPVGFGILIEEKAAMAILMLIFVVLCVRSFITARRARA